MVSKLKMLGRQLDIFKNGIAKLDLAAPATFNSGILKLRTASTMKKVSLFLIRKNRNLS
jgi:hypothetical protein